MNIKQQFPKVFSGLGDFGEQTVSLNCHSNAPELFQKRMQHILEGLIGDLCHMDDVLIFGSNKDKHDKNLLAALKKLEAAGAALNPNKCEFYKTSI